MGLPSLKIWFEGLVGLLRWPKCIRIVQGSNSVSFCHVMYKLEYKVRVFFLNSHTEKWGLVIRKA
jgi:hypothetical protein